jgi:hypothetical protein
MVYWALEKIIKTNNTNTKNPVLEHNIGTNISRMKYCQYTHLVRARLLHLSPDILYLLWQSKFTPVFCGVRVTPAIFSSPRFLVGFALLRRSLVHPGF